MAFNRSYANIVKEDHSKAERQLFDLVRSGKSSELNSFLSNRRYARSLLTSMWTHVSTKDHLSLLMIAASVGDDMIVRELLSHSPNIAKLVELRGQMHSVNGDLVNNVTALWCALDRAHFIVARTLIEIGKANVNHGPLHPLLIDAVIRGRLDIVRFLVDNDYADIDQTKRNDEHGCNSLIESVACGHTSIVEYLIGKNAKLELKTSTDGNTALAVAAIKGNLALVQFLHMAGASLSERNHANKTPIRLAAENEHFNVMDYFLEQDHDDVVFNDLELGVASHTGRLRYF